MTYLDSECEINSFQYCSSGIQAFKAIAIEFAGGSLHLFVDRYTDEYCTSQSVHVPPNWRKAIGCRVCLGSIILNHRVSAWKHQDEALSLVG